MCFSIYKQSNVMKLCLAGQNVQKIIDDGTLPEAFDKNRHGEAHKSVVAFDLLAKAVAVVIDEHKEVSPFLRYRREILADTDIGSILRELVLNLGGGVSVDLFELLTVADDHHTRIALECIADAARHPVGYTHIIELRDVILSTDQTQRSAA